MLRTFFPLINFENPLYFWVRKGGLGAALPDQLGSQNFTWLSIYQKGMGIAWVLIHTKSLYILCHPIVYATAAIDSSKSDKDYQADLNSILGGEEPSCYRKCCHVE